MMTLIFLLLGILLFRQLNLIIQHYRSKSLVAFKAFTPARKQPLNYSAYIQAKPQWVINEVVRLKALMPDAGCRTIATTFNRLHRDKSGMTVSKSWCADKIQKYRYEIRVIRKHIKHRKPKPMPKNIIWAADLTTVTDEQGKQRKVLAFIDHGTRSCLFLEYMTTISSLAVLRALLDTIEKYGKPKYLRTDNEGSFTGRQFCYALRFLGIKHQRTETCCPWQNGRVERFYATFKQKIKQVSITSAKQLTSALQEYRFWYNHIRPHDHLGGYTPAEVWDKRDLNTRKAPQLFQAWEGVLTGYYFEP